MKMHQYLKNWGTDIDQNHHYLLAVINKTLHFTWYSIRNRVTSPLGKENDAYCRVSDVELTWLGLYAFHATLSRKPTSYRRLLSSLMFSLQLPKYAKTRKALEPLAARGLKILTISCIESESAERKISVHTTNQ
ncbi:hypothetical protein BS47DRAFT_1287048 [Hydnum rufescens UP504]|uniref:Uncharacterized protein n=1 Tax=Hydnum rufescens UP504 TaxID=1448309 RepID=A0A9P6BAU0_9AGAM|nr:hypothetical protein BS47DRAFT_1287048 [Hydnum rufescens UP504]